MMSAGSHPLSTASCPIDDHSIGERWEVADTVQLARLISLIAMGQAAQANHVLSNLLPATPAFTLAELTAEARIKLTVQDVVRRPRTGYPRWQRDGFMFEAISWIAARQVHGSSVYLKDPHVSATSQGLDGLMLELSKDKSRIDRTTIFEDKCTDNAKSTFGTQVIPAFKTRHSNERCAEIIATATALLGKAGIADGDAARIAADVTDRTKRRYRAAFAVTPALDNLEARKDLFSGYSQISDIQQTQRLGACLVVPPKLRDWFDELAALAIAYLVTLEEGEADV